jgi:hypothetical protein
MAFDIMNFYQDDEATATISLDEATLRKLDINKLPAFQTVAEYDFNTGVQNWFSGYAAGIFTPAIASHGDGMLKLTARNNRDCFGYWTSPLIPVNSDMIYRATMTVSTDVSDRQEVPQFRLRFLTVNIHASSCVHIESNGNAHNSPVAGEKKTYHLFIIPPKSAEQDGMHLSIDMINFEPSDQSTGSIYLDDVKIEAALNILDQI